MIEYHYETDFKLERESDYTDWITRVIGSEGSKCGQLHYIFCSDPYLLGINLKFLNHDAYTDIITFDYSDAGALSGDIFISVERVRENAKEHCEPFEKELLRVMVHGILHLLGHKDKTKENKADMRALENAKIKLFHVEQ